MLLLVNMPEPGLTPNVKEVQAVLALHLCTAAVMLMQMLHVQIEGANQPEHFESINGITPAMRNARKRHFNNAHIDHLEVQAVEDDLLQLASVTSFCFQTC